MNSIFPQYKPVYDLRNKRYWINPYVKTDYHGTETVSLRGLKRRGIVPLSLQNIKSIEKIKAEIKKWEPNGCTCRLCKFYIPRSGFFRF